MEAERPSLVGGGVTAVVYERESGPCPAWAVPIKWPLKLLQITGPPSSRNSLLLSLWAPDLESPMGPEQRPRPESPPCYLPDPDSTVGSPGSFLRSIRKC